MIPLITLNKSMRDLHIERKPVRENPAMIGLPRGKRVNEVMQLNRHSNDTNKTLHSFVEPSRH